MKKKYAFLLRWFVGLIMINTTCTDEYWFKKMTYDATLYDTLGGNPVQGVWVSLEACTNGPKTYCDRYHVGQNVTDASGHFVIHNNAAKSGAYYIFIKGYGALNNPYNTSAKSEG